MTKNLFTILFLFCSAGYSQSIKSFMFSPDSLMEAGSCKLLQSGYIVTGKYYANGSFVNYVIRYHNDGSVKWTRQESAGHMRAIVDVTEDENKSLYFLAEDPYSSSYYSLLKTDSLGNFNWSVDLDKAGYGSYGSPRLKYDGSGNIYVLSSTYEKTHLYKLAVGTGSITWSRTFDIDFIFEKNPGFDLVLTGDGGVICTGKADSDIFMVCVSPSGTLNWNKRMNDFGNSYSHAKCITRLNDGNYIIAGFRGENFVPFLNGIFLLKIDSTGTVLHYKFYYDSLKMHAFIPENIHELPNGNIRVTGNGGPLTIADFDASLNIIQYTFWTQLMNAQSTSNCFDMVGDELLITCGDRVDKQFVLRSLLANAAFCQMDFVGSYESQDIPVNESLYTHSINFIDGPPAVNTTINLFPVTPYIHSSYCGPSEITLGENNEALKTGFDIYPNPVLQGELINVKTNNLPGSYVLYNANGAVLSRGEIVGVQNAISTANLAPGVYFMRFYDGTGSDFSQKIIVQ